MDLLASLFIGLSKVSLFCGYRLMSHLFARTCGYSIRIFLCYMPGVHVELLFSCLCRLYILFVTAYAFSFFGFISHLGYHLFWNSLWHSIRHSSRTLCAMSACMLCSICVNCQSVAALLYPFSITAITSGLMLPLYFAVP